MKTGIDGNMWYCSNGLCLGDPRSEFTFERTLGEAVESFRREFGHHDPVPDDLLPYLHMTPEEYKKEIVGLLVSKIHERRERLK